MLRSAGFAFRIYTDDHTPPHMHVIKAGKVVIIELDPVRIIRVQGMRDADIVKAADSSKRMLRCFRPHGGRFMATYERKRPLSDAEILRQANEARALQREMRTEGLVAVDARYDAPSRRVLIEMSGGLLVGVPVGAVAALADASDAQLADVEVDELGSGLHWASLDADVGILGLLYGQLGYDALRRAAAAAGGRVSSDAKAAAARANGRKGGRPRKQMVAEKAPRGFGEVKPSSGNAPLAKTARKRPTSKTKNGRAKK